MIRWPLFLPDLTLWYEWHDEHGTLPAPWAGCSLPAICRDLGVPAWAPWKPWKVKLPGVEVRDERGAEERVLSWVTARGTLTSRWTLGPDGDWWRSEYPVKASADLEAACLVAEARTYTLREGVQPDDDGLIHAVELPMRPWSDLFHSFLGWSEGLLLFMEEEDRLRVIVQTLEEKLADLERELAALAPDAVLLPDNLDGQFIPPAAFEQHLAPSYARAASTFRASGTAIVVHAGGPASRLLAGLAAAGVDCVEGICGPPQGDTPLADARKAAGKGMTLWGGIPQDAVLASCADSDFRSLAARAFETAEQDPDVVAGVADRVPPQALPERLTELARMAREARGPRRHGQAGPARRLHSAE